MIVDLKASAPFSTKCFFSFTAFVFGDRPPTQTFNDASMELRSSPLSFFKKDAPNFLLGFVSPSFFSFSVHTSTSIVFPSSSEPLRAEMADWASSAVGNAQQPRPLDITSEILGLVPQVSSKCFSSFFQVVSLDKPPTHTLRSASILPSLSILL